jgi:hypothetical protein
MIRYKPFVIYLTLLATPCVHSIGASANDSPLSIAALETVGQPPGGELHSKAETLLCTDPTPTNSWRPMRTDKAVVAGTGTGLPNLARNPAQSDASSAAGANTAINCLARHSKEPSWAKRLLSLLPALPGSLPHRLYRPP